MYTLSTSCPPNGTSPPIVGPSSNILGVDQDRGFSGVYVEVSQNRGVPLKRGVYRGTSGYIGLRVEGLGSKVYMGFFKD